MIASAHYSERAYVLTRNFIRHALEYPVKSFADEIQGYYVKGGRLSEVVEEVRELVRASEEKGSGSAEAGVKMGVEGEGAVEGEDGVPVLPNRQAGVSGKVTPGGLIPLKRTLKALEKLEEGIVVIAPP
jgi:ubiquitin-conjugating enzyme E2 O